MGAQCRVGSQVTLTIVRDMRILYLQSASYTTFVNGSDSPEPFLFAPYSHSLIRPNPRPCLQ